MSLKDVLSEVARRVAGNSALPAVPVQDWCDQLAAVVACAQGASVAVTMLAKLGEEGRVLRAECAAAAISPFAWPSVTRASAQSADLSQAALGAGPVHGLDAASARTSNPGVTTGGQVSLGAAGHSRGSGADDVASDARASSHASFPTVADLRIRMIGMPWLRMWRFDEPIPADIPVPAFPAEPHGEADRAPPLSPDEEQWLLRRVDLRGCWENGPPADFSGCVARLPSAPGWALIIGLFRPAGSPASVTDPAILRACMPSAAARAQLAFNPDQNGQIMFLSPREVEVLEALKMGSSVIEIAARMKRSKHTVHDHVKTLHQKLGTKARGELVARSLGHFTSVPRPKRVRSRGARGGAHVQKERTGSTGAGPGGGTGVSPVGGMIEGKPETDIARALGDQPGGGGDK